MNMIAVGEMVKTGPYPIINILFRFLSLRCPVCGQSSILQSPFQIKHHCSSCQALFKREEGFFVGAILINVVTTEFVILVVYFLCLLVISFNDQLVLTILFIVAMLFPIAFYHHSWSLWLSFDHLVETLPRYEEQGSGQREGGSADG